MTPAPDPKAALRALAGWTPFRLERAADGPKVQWLRLVPGGLSEPFFDRSVRRHLEAPDCRIATTRIEALELLPRLTTCLPPSGFIFHFSRSGSTLLANALKADPENLVISEPGPVNQLLAWPEHRTDQETWHRRFQGLLACLGQPLEPSQRRLFVKFSSHNLLDIAWILAAFPDVPWLCLTRDPLEVLVSALTRPPRWMRLYDQPEQAAAQLGLRPEDLAGMSRERYGARVLARFSQVALEVAGQGGALIDYRQLSPDSLGAVVSRLGLSPAPDCLARMTQAFAVDAKAAEARPFVEDSEAKQAHADAKLREACAGELATLTAALEARREVL